MQKKKGKKVNVRDLRPARNVKGGGKVNFSDIPVSKPVDKSSPGGP